MTAEWRMEEPSTLYEDILSGQYDVIHWDCDSHDDESQRDTWSEVSDYNTRNTGVLDDNNEPIESTNYGDYESKAMAYFRIWCRGYAPNLGQFDTESGYDTLRIFDGNTMIIWIRCPDLMAHGLAHGIQPIT